MAPRGWVEAEAGTTLEPKVIADQISVPRHFSPSNKTHLSVDEELLEVPRDVVRPDRVVHQLTSFSDLLHSLWACLLK